MGYTGWWFASFGYFPAFVSHHSILSAIPVLGRVPSAVSFPSWDGSSAVHILPSRTTWDAPEEPPFQKNQLGLCTLQGNQLGIQGYQMHQETVKELLPVDVYKGNREGQRFDHQQLKSCSGSWILPWDHLITPCIKLILELCHSYWSIAALTNISSDCGTDWFCFPFFNPQTRFLKFFFCNKRAFIHNYTHHSICVKQYSRV